MSTALPTGIHSAQELEELLSRPSPRVIEFMRRLEGDLMVLGVGGKMGLTLARLARRAIDEAGGGNRVVGVSRFSDPLVAQRLQAHGIETLSCDLLAPDSVAQLPAAPNVIFMAGRKFGTQADTATTWAANTLMPGYVGHRFRGSRIVAFSTGCVYPLVGPETGGCTEQTRPAPIGEYAQSCLGRERVFGFVSRQYGTRVCLFRLNYAVELRYGVLHDIAQRIKARRPVDLSVPAANVIWQGDANGQAILALDACESPAVPLNITGPETFSIQEVARQLGDIMGIEPAFAGQPGATAYLNNASKAAEIFGYPSVPLQTILRWTADWVMNNGKSLGKPTHFEVNDGNF